MNQEVKPRTAYQKFKLIMELFEHYAQLLVDQCWLEVAVFEIPAVNLQRQDQEDLAYIISSKVPVEVQFLRTTREIFKLRLKGLRGSVNE